MNGEIIIPNQRTIYLYKDNCFKYYLGDGQSSHRFQSIEYGIKFALNISNSMKNWEVEHRLWHVLSLDGLSGIDSEAGIDPGIIVRALRGSPGEPTKI